MRKKSRKQTRLAITGSNVDISMYASPAYGTHQVFTEPGLDHLYEPIDKYVHEEETTAFQDATPTTAKDDETDVEGYLKMKSSCEVDQADGYLDLKSSSEVIDQAVTEKTDVDGYLDMKSSEVVDQAVTEQTDVDAYLDMKSSSEVVDQAVTEGADVDGYLDMKSSKVVDQAVTEQTDVDAYLDMKSPSEVGNTESYTNIDEQ